MCVQWGTNNTRLPARWRHDVGLVRKLSMVCLHNNACCKDCIVGHPNPASARSVLLVLLEPHYVVHSETMVTSRALNYVGHSEWVNLVGWAPTLHTLMLVRVKRLIHRNSDFKSAKWDCGHHTSICNKYNVFN